MEKCKYKKCFTCRSIKLKELYPKKKDGNLYSECLVCREKKLEQREIEKKNIIPIITTEEKKCTRCKKMLNLANFKQTSIGYHIDSCFTCREYLKVRTKQLNEMKKNN